MTAFKTTKVELLATMAGYLWMPGCPATKNIRVRITRRGEPFAQDWAGDFRALLLNIDTKEGGDFQRCRFLDACLVITRTAATKNGRTERIRCVDLNREALADYFWPEDKAEAFIFEGEIE